MAKYIIYSSLDDNLFERVVNYKSAKEVWDALVILHEGTEEVRKNKESLLVKKYEIFPHEHGKDIIATNMRDQMCWL